MPSYANSHKELANGQIHPPRDYSLAGNATFLGKDINGELAWDRMTWDAPVIGFIADESTASSADGARYIVTASSSASFSGASVNDVVQYLTVDYNGTVVNEWNFITPVAGCTLYATSLDAFYYFDGASWQSLVSGSTGKEPDSVTKTFAGSNIGTYIDLYTPTVGNEIERILFKGSGITPTDAIIKVVLHDGTPANDVDITSELFAAEFNNILYNYGANGQTVSSGFSLKLLVSGNDINTGTLKVITYYLP